MENSEGDYFERATNSENGISGGMKMKLTLEIPLFMLMFGSILGGTPMSNLIMYRTCVHSLQRPEAECRSFLEPEALNHTQELEQEVQEYCTIVTTVKALVEGLGPAVLALFVGVWSDKHGRKPVLVCSMLGMATSAIASVVYAQSDSLGPWWSILATTPLSLGGSYIVLLIATYCYISDVTPTESRSVRIVLIQVSLAVASTTSSLVSPYLLKAVGTVYLLLIVATLQTFAFALTKIFINESLENATQGTLLTVFNISHVKQMFKSCFERKPNYGRAVILLTVAAGTLSVFTVYGSYTLFYLYTRNRIQWTMKDFTTFSAVSSAMWFSGSFFGVAVVQKLLHISDLNFILISFFSCIAEYTIKTFAVNTWQMYLGSAISLFGTVSGSLIRSFLTKALASEEVAKVLGLMGAADAFLPLLSPVVYNALYAATLAGFPQSIMVLTSLINVLCFAFILIVQYLRHKATSTPYQSIQSDEM